MSLRGGLGLFLLALVIRLGGVVSWGRLHFDGHERQLVGALSGPSPDPGPAAWPLASALVHTMGALGLSDPRALVALAAAVGSLGVVLSAALAGQVFDRRTALWTGLLVSVLPEQAAWSTSVYPVIVGHTLLVGTLACRRPVAAALCGLLATAFRPELAPLLLLRGLPGLPGTAAGLLWIGVYVEAGPSDPLRALIFNLPLLSFIGPTTLLVGLYALREVRGRRLALGLLATHLIGGLFDDYGARHALLAGVLGCVLAARAATTAGPRLGPALGLVALSGGVLGTVDLAHRWNNRAGLEDRTLARLPSLPADCQEVSEEPPIEGQRLPSAFACPAPDFTGCVVWGEEAQHRAWSSRGLRDRATRMRLWFDLEPLAALDPGPGRPLRVYQRLEPRLWLPCLGD